MNGDRPAFIADDRAVSYVELEARVAAAASLLRERGVRAGTRVGVLAANGPDWIVAAHAIPRAGGVIVPLNIRLADAEIRARAGRASVRVLFSATSPEVPEIPARVSVISFDELRGAPSSHDPFPTFDTTDTDRDHAVLFTSGTTGQPKGAVLSWGNHLASARACTAVLPLAPGDRWLASLPFFHIGGLNILYRCAIAGACVVLPDSFGAEDLNRAIDAHAVTHASLVETTLRSLLDARGGRPFPPSLRAIVAGGGPIANELVQACPQVLASYGLTETCSMATLVRPGAAPSARRSAGPPLPGVDVRIATNGRIEIRGPIVMRGYLDDPDATRDAFDGDWLRTGDLGEIDADGALHVLARREDLILSGGENVYPAEIEEILRAHPSVAQAIVIGIADAKWGQVPLALVVPRRGREHAAGSRADGVTPRERAAEPPAPLDLRSFLEARLARFKIPRIVYADEIPHLANGKPDRAAIRARYDSTGMDR